MLEQFVDLLTDLPLAASHAFVLGVLLLCGLGMPLPEDVVLVTGGVMTFLARPVEPTTLAATLAHPHVWAMTATGLLGCLAGDSILFLAGRRFGGRVAEIPLLRRLLPEAKRRRVEEMARRHGPRVVFLARFMPGLRSPTFFATGHAGVPVWTFLVYDGLAALVSVPVWVSLGYYFGDDLRLAARAASRFGWYLLAAVLVVVAAMVVRAVAQRRAARQSGSGAA